MFREFYILLYKNRGVHHPALHPSDTISIDRVQRNLPSNSSPETTSLPDESTSSRMNNNSNNNISRNTNHFISYNTTANLNKTLTPTYRNTENSNNISNRALYQRTSSINNNARVFDQQVKETHWAVRSSNPNADVPALDLTGLNMEDKDDTDATAGRDSSKRRGDEKSNKSVTVSKEETLFVRKQRPSFVFPSEKSLADYDVIGSRAAPVSYEEPQASSPSTTNAHTTTTLAKQGAVASHDHKHNLNGENSAKTISFSLANLKFGKYLLVDDVAHQGVVGGKDDDGKKNEKQIVATKKREDLIKLIDETNSEARRRAEEKAEVVHSPSKATEESQTVIDVVVVNGHFNKKESNNHLPNNEENTSDDTDDENAKGEDDKPPQKHRVTFSFDNDFYSHRSLKAYIPVVPSANLPLQGVLKKRAEPLQEMSDSETNKPFIRQDYSRERNVAYRSHSDQPKYMEQSVHVKHINSTSSDLVVEAKRCGSTHMHSVASEKPPTGSNRISLSVAEKSAIAGSSRRINLAYSPGSKSRSKANYVRSTSMEDNKYKSKSADNINQEDSPYYNARLSNMSGRTRSNNLPFTLRRCGGSEQSLVTVANNKSRPVKPKIAFGSFILPKETTSRLQTVPMKFQEVSDSPQMSSGSYVHTHTRRSPYAVPAQILYRDDSKQGVAVGSIRRPYTAHTRQHPQQQQVLVERHSAPSTYGSTRKRGWPGMRQQFAGDAPSVRQQHKPSAPRNSSQLNGVNSGDELLEEVLSNKTRYPAVISKGQTLNVDSLRRQPDIATLNMMANKAKGASQYRFITKLNDRSDSNTA